MNLTIRIPNLIKQLKNADDESERFADPLRGINGGGVRYLYGHVLLPLLEGKAVNTDELDMERFDREDIVAIFGFYTDHFTSFSKEVSKLKYWYDVCCKTPAKCTRTAFL